MSKKKHYPLQPEDEAELIIEGFEIHKFNDLHWRFRKEEYSIAVDVWPTTRKIYLVEGGRGSETYESLFEAVTKIFNRAPRT